MDLEVEFVFRSETLQNKCFNCFKDMKLKKQFCDVTFQTDGNSISAHRVVIAAAIPFFRDSFFTSDGDPAENDEILPFVDANIFRCFIDFAYSCELKINSRNVRDLLKGACHLRVDEVREACCRFLTDRLQPENVISIRELANSLHCRELLENVDFYIMENFVLVSQTEEFLNASFSFMRVILGSDELLVPSEEDVFESVMKWVTIAPENRKRHLPELLRGVRLPLLKPLYLRNAAKEEIIQESTECRSILNVTSSCTANPRGFARWINTSLETENGLIYKYLGKILSNVEASDGEKKAFTTGYSCDLNGCAFASLSGDMYVFNENISFCYNSQTKTMPSFKSIDPARSFASAVSLKNKLYVFGGSTQETATNNSQFFDPRENQWTQINPMGTNRAGPCAAVLGDYVFVFGGTDYRLTHDSAERFSSRTGKWKVISPMFTRRCIASAAAIKGKIYVCGGDASPKAGVLVCIATAEVYDPIQNQWQFISSMNTARCELILLAYKKKLYAFGGYNDKRKPLSDVETYDPEGEKWKKIQSGYSDCLLSAAVVI